MIGATIAVAAATALFAIAFRSSLNACIGLIYQSSNIVAGFERLAWYQRLIIPVIGGSLAGWIASHARRHRSGHGVGGIMEAVVLGTSKISFRASAWKALGCWVASVSGGSIGREGPIIQMGGALGRVMARPFRLDHRQTRTILCAGTAAGFAAAYNTPLAAVLFVVEVVTGVMALDLVLISLLATTIATVLTRIVIGGGPIYGERVFTISSEYELWIYAALGVAAGLAGCAFNFILAEGERFFQKLAYSSWLSAALGGAVVGLLAMTLPNVTGNGYEVINLILDGRLALTSIVLLFFMKPLATTASVASGSPGGVFTPSLFLGAALGFGWGHVSTQFFPGFSINPGAYALVGMAAVCAAMIHAPLMACVLVFELSRDYEIVVPTLIATTMATVVSKLFRSLSIYEEELRHRGLGWKMTLEGRSLQEKPLVSESTPL